MPPTIGKIEITGVSPEVAQMVLDRLAVRAGDPTSPEMIDLATAEVRQIDEHFRVGVTLGADDPPSSTGATLHIAIKSIALARSDWQAHHARTGSRGRESNHKD